MLVTRQLTVAIGFQNIYYLFYFLLLWNSMSTAYLITNILQNILFCVQQKKEISDLEQLEGEKKKTQQHTHDR